MKKVLIKLALVVIGRLLNSVEKLLVKKPGEEILLGAKKTLLNIQKDLKNIKFS